MADSQGRTSISIVLCDPHPIVRKGIYMSLAELPEMQIAAECSHLRELAPLCELWKPDIVLLGHELTPSQWAEFIEEAHAEDSTCGVILLSPERRDSEYARRAIESGIRGIFYRDQATDLLVSGIREVFKGGLWFERSHTEAFVRSMQLERRRRRLEGHSGQENRTPLTSRQLRIVELVQRGKSNKEIAHLIFVSQATVAYELTNIYRALGVTDRMQLILKTKAARVDTADDDLEPPPDGVNEPAA